jgi:pimeloyl-ACP methyl ester carboxylesterase
MNLSNNVLQLKDKRLLAFAEYGDSRGLPLFFFHGSPGSRLFHPPDEITLRLGVRLICVDRPGYGMSAFQPGRCILDWPLDIVQLADSLGIDNFSVTGHSGGGPYALACAQLLPGRVLSASLLSAAGPVNAPDATRGMKLLNWFGFKYGQHIPWVLGRTITSLLFRERCIDPGKAMDRETGHRPPADDALIANPAIRHTCLQSEIEAFRHGLLGFAWDIRLLTRLWGLRLEEINIPVYLWHGTMDDATSISMACYLAEMIPNAKLTSCKDEAHLLLFPHWEDILSQIVME